MNITQDVSKRVVTIEHPNLGAVIMSEHLKKCESAPLSDTATISDPGWGGGRVYQVKKDKARKITVEVATGSVDELFLQRCKRFLTIPFSLEWIDESNGAIESQAGVGLECYIKDAANDRGADTQTFEIYSLEYSGD